MQRKYAYIWDVHVHSRLATASSGMSWQVFCGGAGIICRPRWENHILDMTGGIFMGRFPVINDKILVFNIILLNINSSNRCFK